MIRAYESPEAFRQALEQRIRAASKAEKLDMSRYRQVLIFDRFLARVFAEFGNQIIVKGGVVLELRLERARTTRDVDLRVMGDPETVFERLRKAGQMDLGDFLSFDIEFDLEHPSIEGDGIVYGGKRFQAQGKLAGKIYGMRFGVDAGFGDVLTVEPEIVAGTDFFAFVGVKAAEHRVYPRVAHIAEKLHAYTLPRRNENSRVKDLPDIALLGQTERFAAASFLPHFVAKKFRYCYYRTMVSPKRLAALSCAALLAGCSLLVSLDELGSKNEPTIDSAVDGTADVIETEDALAEATTDVQEPPDAAVGVDADPVTDAGTDANMVVDTGPNPFEPRCNDPQDGGPKYYWPFDEGTGLVVKDCYAGLDGVASASYNWTNAGKRGAAMWLDGGSVNMGPGVDTPWPSGFSVSAWIKVPSETLSGPFRIILGRADCGQGWLLGLNSGSISVSLGRGYGGCSREILSGKVIPPDTWVHVAFVYSGNQVLVCSSGSCISTQDDAGMHSEPPPFPAFRVATSGTVFGAGTTSPIAVDDVAIYQRALTLTEVAGLAGR